MKLPAIPDSSSGDRPGKVFKVEPPWRRCMVCEQRFTPEDARKLAHVLVARVPQNTELHVIQRW